MWHARPMHRTPDGAPQPFAEAKEYQRTRYLAQARVALTAAGPHLLSEARGDVGELAQLIRDESNAYDGRYVINPNHLADEIMLAGWHK